MTICKPPQVARLGIAGSRVAVTRTEQAMPGRGWLRSPNQSGFTLVEMLIVIAIIAIIAALSFSALMLAPQNARIKGTEALIAKLDAKLTQKLNEFNQRRESIIVLDGIHSTSNVDLVLAGGDPNRARVIAVKRTMRQTFPELFYFDKTRESDGMDNDGDGRVDEPNPITLVPPGDEIIAGQWNPVFLSPLLYQRGSELPPVALTYRRYVEKAFADNSSFVAFHQPATARAECLYMILTNCGTDTADFSADEIRDTDGDGLPEFVDKFGNPIQFYLWPSYYGVTSLTKKPPTTESEVGPSHSPKQNPGAETDSDDPNQLLIERSTPPSPTDWWANPNRTTFERLSHTLTHFLPTSGLIKEQPKGFRTYPLIVSAGPDGGFGFRCVSTYVGLDGIMGSLDDTDAPGPSQQKLPAIGLMASVGSNGFVDSGDTGAPYLSAAMSILEESVDGNGMDTDNIDNHHLRAK